MPEQAFYGAETAIVAEPAKVQSGNHRAMLGAALDNHEHGMSVIKPHRNIRLARPPVRRSGEKDAAGGGIAKHRRYNPIVDRMASNCWKAIRREVEDSIKIISAAVEAISQMIGDLIDPRIAVARADSGVPDGIIDRKHQIAAVEQILPNRLPHHHWPVG